MVGKDPRSVIRHYKLSYKKKACDVALTYGFDLEQIYEARDPSFFMKNGIIKGIARRFVKKYSTVNRTVLM